MPRRELRAKYSVAPSKFWGGEATRFNKPDGNLCKWVSLAFGDVPHTVDFPMHTRQPGYETIIQLLELWSLCLNDVPYFVSVLRG